MPVAGGVQYVNIPVEIDTKTLSDIAQTTDGNFYRATNNNELKKIYRDIDKLEKTKFNVKHFAKRYEAYQAFALAALLVLLVEFRNPDTEPLLIIGDILLSFGDIPLSFGDILPVIGDILLIIG